MSRGLSRPVVAAVGLLASVGVSVALYLLTDSLFVFLFVPFVPLFLGRGDRETYRCPTCGFETTEDAVDYCPRDGTELD